MASWKINALKNNLNFLHGLAYVRVILVQFLKLVFEMLRKWIEEGGKKYRNEAKQFSFEQKVPYIYTNLHQMLRKKEWMQRFFFLKRKLCCIPDFVWSLPQMLNWIFPSSERVRQIVGSVQLSSALQSLIFEWQFDKCNSALRCTALWSNVLYLAIGYKA